MGQVVGQVDGKVCIVTGGAGSIGLASVRLLLQEGAKVALVDIDEGKLARAAAGSMRDALSLLDQALAYGNGRLTDREVAAMLGSLDRGRVIALLQNLAKADARKLLDSVRQLDEFVPDYDDILGDLAGLLQQRGVEIITPDDPAARGAQLSLRFAAATSMLERLAEHGVVADYRAPDIIRVAPIPLYNTFHECWQLASILSRITDGTLSG